MSVVHACAETMTVTSEGSAIKARIRSLKQQLRQRQREVKKVRNEQNRKKKAMLKQHEEQLKKKLEVSIMSCMWYRPCFTL